MRICIDEISSRSHTSGGLEGKILAHLPVYGLPVSVLSWKDLRQESLTVEPCSTFRVSLRDQNNNLVNMNGIHWSFCLLAQKYELEHASLWDRGYAPITPDSPLHTPRGVGMESPQI